MNKKNITDLAAILLMLIGIGLSAVDTNKANIFSLLLILAGILLKFIPIAVIQKMVIALLPSIIVFSILSLGLFATGYKMKDAIIVILYCSFHAFVLNQVSRFYNTYQKPPRPRIYTTIISCVITLLWLSSWFLAALIPLGDMTYAGSAGLYIFGTIYCLTSAVSLVATILATIIFEKNYNQNI